MIYICYVFYNFKYTVYILSALKKKSGIYRYIGIYFLFFIGTIKVFEANPAGMYVALLLSCFMHHIIYIIYYLQEQCCIFIH